MTPPSCRPRWPEELGACVCSIHGTWLTPVATGTLAGVRHAGDFGGIGQQLATAQRPDDEPACAGDALWLQDICSARTKTHLPWGRARPQELVRIVDAVAREVAVATASGAGPLGLPADRRQGSVKSFAFEICNGERVGASLPTQLRQRQRLLARVSHVLRWPPAERACFLSWSTASIKRLALMRDWPNGTLTWICPPAAERRCDGSSASRRGTSTHAPPCLRRSSDSASRLCSDASNKVPFAEYSFRVAAYSFKVAVISFFDTQAACRKTITRRCNVSSNSRSRSRVGSILLTRTWP